MLSDCGINYYLSRFDHLVATQTSALLESMCFLSNILSPLALFLVSTSSSFAFRLLNVLNKL